MSFASTFARMSLSLLCVFSGAAVFAQPAQRPAEDVRQIPPRGIDIPQEERDKLASNVAGLQKAISALAIDSDAPAASWLPDVWICTEAVRNVLENDEFFHRDDVKRANRVLDLGLARLTELATGQPAWPDARGLVVCGYLSKIDGSVQPYGLVMPKSYSETGGPYRLDVWFHGRGETLSEVNFISERMQKVGEFAPPDTIVLHPYGRYCNAFKFAGEVDVLEAIEDVCRRYRIDRDRISVRGFSMGGAAAWHFAVHHADRWVAANPGAGFAESARYLKLLRDGQPPIPEYERKLWHWYDATDYAGNLRHCPTVAYSGEIDPQKQAADVMAEALAKDGLELRHVIGPGTKHRYHPAAAKDVDDAIASIARRGRERVPRNVSLTTYTLKYNRMHWVTVDGLEEHWRRARVEATLGESLVDVSQAENVTALTLSLPAGWAPFDVGKPVTVRIGGVDLVGPRPLTDRSWRCSIHQAGGQWQLGEPSETPLRKRHDLQGPIDDAFMDAFVFVRPTGTSGHAEVAKWTDAEFERAVDQWRRQFRGRVRIVDDTEVDGKTIEAANLILWGDAASNAVLRRIADRLPIQWDQKAIRVGTTDYAAEHHALVMIYPNPLNPRRYVVLNSGFTFREADYLSNARQTPKLPDWAVIDVRTPPGPRQCGKVVAANFFDESWSLQPE